jgi:transcriptional regulator with XRE-family HTH domain
MAMAVTPSRPGTHPTDVAVRKNLRRLREHRGLSITDVAPHVRICASTLASYERHTNVVTSRAIPIKALPPLAEFYGVRVCDLFDETAIIMVTRGGMHPARAAS